MVHFWDLKERKWKLVYLKKEEKKKGEEEDEADEAEDLKEPWTTEEEDEGKEINGGEDCKQKE